MVSVMDSILDLARDLKVAILGPVLVKIGQNDATVFSDAAFLEIIKTSDAVLDRLPDTKGHSTLRITMLDKVTGEVMTITTTVNRDDLRALLDA